MTDRVPNPGLGSGIEFSHVSLPRARGLTMIRAHAAVAPLLAVITFSIALTGVEPAQSRPPAAQTVQAAQPIFRSGVDLVRLDVRATGRDDRPVKDLRAEEVEVFEQGTLHPILLFQHVEDPQGSYIEVAQRTIASEVSTNQGAPRGHLYVLAFDQNHILPGNEQRARLAAQRFLRTRLRPGDRVALFALPGPGAQIEFTSDAPRVAGELAGVRGLGEETGNGALGAMRIADAYEIVRGNAAILSRYMNRLSQEPVASDVRTARRPRVSAGLGAVDPAELRRLLLEDARVLVARADEESRRFLASLSDLALALGSVEGRKTVILFSEGFDTDNITHELEQVAAATAKSYCVIHAMDLNVRSVSPSAEEPRGTEPFGQIQSRLQALGTLSGETDGTLITDAASRLDRAFARIAETSQDYYLVGFAPSEAALKDRTSYRRVEVKVRRPGVRVSARTGYTLSPEPFPLDSHRAIDAALRAPFSQQGLKVEYTTYVLGGSRPDVERVILSLSAELPVAEGDARDADVAFVVRDARDRHVAASGSDRIALPQLNRAGATTGTGLFRVQFELPAGSYLMRAVVREPGGLVGSADRRFHVRPLGGPGVTAGDLVLGSAETEGPPVRAMAYDTEALSGVLELYAGAAGLLDRVEVTVDLLPLGQQAAVRSSRANLQDIRRTGRGFSRGARIELPLGDVQPGQYLVRARVRSGSETAADLLRDVQVIAKLPAPTPQRDPR